MGVTRNSPPVHTELVIQLPSSLFLSHSQKRIPDLMAPRSPPLTQSPRLCMVARGFPTAEVGPQAGEDPCVSQNL